MKKTLRIFMIFFLLIALVPVPSKAAGNHVHDEASLMTADEVNRLETLADKISSDTGLEIVILTVHTTGVNSVSAYADNYYDLNGYAEDGILFMLAMDEREWYISTCGEAVYAFTDYAVDQLLDIGLPYFSYGEYYEGFAEVISAVPHYIDSHRQGNTVKAPSRGMGSILLVSVLIGLVVAGVVLLIMRSGMNTKRKQRGAVDYMKQGSYYLRLHQDMFLYSQVSKTPRQQNSGSGGSSTHRSSSGRIHGGGGRKF